VQLVSLTTAAQPRGKGPPRKNTALMKAWRIQKEKAHRSLNQQYEVVQPYCYHTNMIYCVPRSRYFLHPLHPDFVYRFCPLQHFSARSLPMSTEVIVTIIYSTLGLVVSCVGLFFAYKLYQSKKWPRVRKAFRWMNPFS
jgi:hypothetical protein